MNTNNYVSLLKLTPLFSDFSSNELLEYFKESNCSIGEYKKNCVIHFESEKCSTMDIILKGEVVVQKIDENGNVLTVTQFNTGDNLGGNLLFSRYPFYPMSVLSKTDSIILHMGKDLVLQLCQNNKHFLLEFLTCVSDKTAILTNKIKSISMKSIKESIIDFLNYEYCLQESYRIELSMTKKELSERLGIQRTSLSRELSKMRKDGLITFDSNSITIENTDILRVK